MIGNFSWERKKWHPCGLLAFCSAFRVAASHPGRYSCFSRIACKFSYTPSSLPKIISGNPALPNKRLNPSSDLCFTFPPTVTIVRPDLNLIWFFDEGGWEYFTSPYSPMLVANVLDLEVEAADQLVGETLGKQKILGYDCEIFRYRNPVTPGWEVTLWKAPELGYFPLKKLERIVKGGVIISGNRRRGSRV